MNLREISQKYVAEHRPQIADAATCIDCIDFDAWTLKQLLEFYNANVEETFNGSFAKRKSFSDKNDGQSAVWRLVAAALRRAIKEAK